MPTFSVLNAPRTLSALSVYGSLLSNLLVNMEDAVQRNVYLSWHKDSIHAMLKKFVRVNVYNVLLKCIIILLYLELIQKNQRVVTLFVCTDRVCSCVWSNFNGLIFKKQESSSATLIVFLSGWSDFMHPETRNVPPCPKFADNSQHTPHLPLPSDFYLNP